MPVYSNEEFESEGKVLVAKKLKEPDRYRVLLHNDDYTSMEFVVNILQVVFKKQLEEATMIMMSVHNQGIGQCGVYTKEVAEAKVNRVHTQAREAGYPLKCTMEKVH